MKFLLIYAHPGAGSFNHALLETTLATLVDAGHEVRVHDLYAIDFNPVLKAEEISQAPDEIKALQADILWADRLFFTYPIWWYGRPAILQGYIDRVFSYGFAYDSGPKGLLKHDRALVFQTTGLPQPVYEGAGDVTIHHAMGPGTLGLCGIPDVTIHTFYAVSKATDDGRQQILADAKTLVQTFAA